MACNFSVIYARRGKNPNEIVGVLVSAANNTNRQVLFYFAFVTKVPAAGAVLVIWITTCASSLHCADDKTLMCTADILGLFSLTNSYIIHLWRESKL